MTEKTISKFESELTASRQARLASLARLDWLLAWVVICVPALAFVIAVSLIFYGYPLTIVEVGLWLGMHVPILIGVEVGFHRHFAHRSFKAHPAVRAALAILGSMAFQGPVIWWAATHRRHHNFSDMPGDPHSPHLFGRGILAFVRGQIHAHMGWLFVPESTRAVGWDRYVQDLYRDRTIFKIHTRYFYWLILGLIIPAIVGGIVYRSPMGVVLGFLWGGLVRIFIMNHVFYWCINSITHTFGTRPFKSGDQSTNNIWLAIPTLGQSWHNNHHAFPSSAIMKLKWWELDLGGLVISLLEKFGLVWDVKTPTPAMIQRLKRG
ncbi:MAG: fatty acid desaturase [Tatlockia sp.]|jgi:stearoyl-CoA desaturase (delta-9 desaturase)|nr:fatty acid desaturase [Tatlockia sp.]